MPFRRASLPAVERGTSAAAAAFLEGRLDQLSTIEWALRLDASDVASRGAILEILDRPNGRQLREPWRSTWRLIEESWRYALTSTPTSLDLYGVREWITHGDRSGALVHEIVALVRPVLEVKLSGNPPSQRPRSPQDVLSLGLTSGEVINPDEIGLRKITDRAFMIELGHELDAAVTKGLDIGQRIGVSNDRHFWRLGGLHRAYFVPASDRPEGEHEPDEFHHGIAPAVKLLYETVSMLADIDLEEARKFVQRWSATKAAVYTRLWAACARNPHLASSSEVESFLLACDERRFWDLHSFPEIAELRACRFAGLDGQKQRAIIRRLKKKPPRSHWPKDASRERVDEGRLYWAVRELRRIEVGGGVLPREQKSWIAAQLVRFDDLRRMTRVDDGFLGTPKARWVPPNPDDQYDLLSGTARLSALEAALSEARRGWDDDPARRASDWIDVSGHSDMLLADLEAAPSAGAAYPNVWDRFGWAHRPQQQTEGAVLSTNADPALLTARVLALLEQLSDETVDKAIDGISSWLSAWQKQIVDLPTLSRIWLRLWPIAVKETNAQQPEEELPDLNVIVRGANDEEPGDLDTLNTPAGKLVGVFIAACPSVSPGDYPFHTIESLRSMRDAAIAASGRSGLIVRHRMIESLSWFQVADPEWTREHLLEPLLSDTSESITLWRAVARSNPRKDILKILGERMATLSADQRLGRETRHALVFNLLIDILFSLYGANEPAISHSRIQQMLRTLDDEVRARAAETVQRFVRDLSQEKNGTTPSYTPEELFRRSARPFLEKIWPQERSLTTPGVSRAFADLPAACRDAFVEAVDAIERFLVPFECWSLVDYGLFGEDSGKPKLSLIDDSAKAGAFLRLLDRTIGTIEGAIVPFDLSIALEKIRQAAPQLAENPSFRRLAARTRR